MSVAAMVVALGGGGEHALVVNDRVVPFVMPPRFNALGR
jgi:hypothetical protein